MEYINLVSASSKHIIDLLTFAATFYSTPGTEVEFYNTYCIYTTLRLMFLADTQLYFAYKLKEISPYKNIKKLLSSIIRKDNTMFFITCVNPKTTLAHSFTVICYEKNYYVIQSCLFQNEQEVIPCTLEAAQTFIKKQKEVYGSLSWLSASCPEELDIYKTIIMLQKSEAGINSSERMKLFKSAKGIT